MTEEWILIKLDRKLPGGFERHREGNRAKFDLETGRKLLLLKRDPWQLVHFKTLVNPLDHDLWVTAMEARRGAGAAARVLDAVREPGGP